VVEVDRGIEQGMRFLRWRGEERGGTKGKEEKQTVRGEGRWM
jgi:hypothetical protein